MNYKRLRQERISFLILLIVALTIALICIFYIKKGMDEEPIYAIGGGLFLFFSAYACYIFIGRLRKVSMAQKVGDVILYDKLRTYKDIAEKLKITEKKVQQSLAFLFNNNYIEGFKAETDRVVNIQEEQNAIKQAFMEQRLETAKVANSRTRKGVNGARCENCGANVVFKDTQAICPYCGNLLKAEDK